MNLTPDFSRVATSPEQLKRILGDSYGDDFLHPYLDSLEESQDPQLASPQLLIDMLRRVVSKYNGVVGGEVVNTEEGPYLSLYWSIEYPHVPIDPEGDRVQPGPDHYTHHAGMPWEFLNEKQLKQVWQEFDKVAVRLGWIMEDWTGEFHEGRFHATPEGGENWRLTNESHT